MKGITTLLICACATLARPAGAIELSLEENRAERGNIGYIDMQRLFKASPETIRAKENFEELVRQAEEQINLRRAEILRLRNELSQLKIEREFLAKTPLLFSAAAVSTSTGTSLSTEAVSAAAPAVPVSTAPVNLGLAELDLKIAQKINGLAQKDEEFKTHQAASEKALLDLESKKTEIILGKIHKAVQEIARQEGISVVVDKSSILFGHDAVDLTEKVLKHLKGS